MPDAVACRREPLLLSLVSTTVYSYQTTTPNDGGRDSNSDVFDPKSPEERSLAPSERLFIVAGEPSGDLHAAHLMARLKHLRPDTSYSGFGGRRMIAEGLDAIEDLPAQAIMGLFPVLRALPRIREWFAKAVVELDRRRPRAVLLVDYPGFNLRLAARAKRGASR